MGQDHAGDAHVAQVGQTVENGPWAAE
jgi:hypothetical protein